MPMLIHNIEGAGNHVVGLMGSTLMANEVALVVASQTEPFLGWIIWYCNILCRSHFKQENSEQTHRIVLDVGTSISMPLPISPYLLHHNSQFASMIGQVNAIIEDLVERFNYLISQATPLAGAVLMPQRTTSIGRMGNSMVEFFGPVAG